MVQFATNLCHCLPFTSSLTVLEQCRWIVIPLSFEYAYYVFCSAII